MGGIFSTAGGNRAISPLLSLTVFLNATVARLFNNSTNGRNTTVRVNNDVSSFLIRQFGVSNRGGDINVLSNVTTMFSTIFTTPLATLTFTLRVIFVGQGFCFGTVLPVAISDLSTFTISRLLNISPTKCSVNRVPGFSVSILLGTVVIVLVYINNYLFFYLSLRAIASLFSHVFGGQFLHVTTNKVFVVTLAVLINGRSCGNNNVRVVSRILGANGAI